VYDALSRSTRYAIAYAECANEKDLEQAMVRFNPSVALYNYYPATMPWLRAEVTRRYKLVQVGVMHEVTQEEADHANSDMFDFHLCPDPTLEEHNPLAVKIPRIIPPYENRFPEPDRLRVGSFGFGIHDKGFVRLIETVQSEFDVADISILMPFNDVVDVAGRGHALETARLCRAAVRKPGIRLEISHNFVEKSELLDFLARNTVNAFFYDVYKNRGISSTIEHALAVHRPMAITRAGMFRHVASAEPSICIEDNSLRAIIANGIAPLLPFYEQWTEPKFLARIEEIFDKLLGKSGNARNSAGGASFNKILDNIARLEHVPTIRRLFEVAPQTMSRKIQEANVQQAFVANTVLHFLAGIATPKTLCVGSFEDTATDLIKARGIRPEEIDPSINYDLEGFFHLPTTVKCTYDTVYSTSVIEHVPNDELFVSQICKLLKSGGVAVLTCDFNDEWRAGMPVPPTDQRLYTLNDLAVRFQRILDENGCKLVDQPQWQGVAPDFVYMGVYRYAFATFVFRKE
jgi:hypothetical protein